MTPLLVLAALLLLVSGLVKLRAGERVGLGIPVLALLEVLVGLALVAFSFLGRMSPRQGLAAVLGAVALVLVSSVRQGLAMKARRQLREQTEGGRLQRYIQVRTDPTVLSETDRTPDPHRG